LGKGKNYLLEGSEILLNFLRDNSKKFILLTSGDKAFQKRKVEATGIAKYFSEIAIVEGRKYKEKYVKSSKSNGSDCLFINDNLKENLGIREAFPKMEVVVKFDDCRYDEETIKKSHLPYFKNLADIKNYVEQKFK
jgi:FMN phosphatase YigB (HAD superfamily)